MAMVTALIEVCAVDSEDGASFLTESEPLDALLAAVLPFVTSASGTLLSLPAVNMVSAMGALFPADLRPQAEAFVAPLIECAESQYPSLAVAALKGLGALANTLRPLDSTTIQHEVINGQLIEYGEVIKAVDASGVAANQALAKRILDEGGDLFLETDGLEVEIVEAAVRAGALLIARCADFFDAAAIGTTVDSLTEKLGSPSTSLVAMVSVVTIVRSTLPISLTKARMDGVFNASTLLLDSPDPAVKQAALVTLKALFFKFGGEFKNKKMKKSLVKEVIALIVPDNFSLCTSALELAAVMRPYATLLIASCAEPAMALVRDFDASASRQLLVALKEFFNAISEDSPDGAVTAMATSLMAPGFKPRAIVTIAQVVATLLCGNLDEDDIATSRRQMRCSADEASTLLATLVAHPTDSAADEACRLHLSVVGEIGTRVNCGDFITELNALVAGVWSGAHSPRIKTVRLPLFRF